MMPQNVAFDHVMLGDFKERLNWLKAEGGIKVFSRTKNFGMKWPLCSESQIGTLKTLEWHIGTTYESDKYRCINFMP